jgi:actin-related protein 5
MVVNYRSKKFYNIVYQDNVHKMQLPFTPAPKPQPVDPEVLKQRRQELAKRLVEINAKKREEKVSGRKRKLNS